MAATHQPLSVPSRDPTPDAALARVREPMRRLEVPLSEWCGDALIEAFTRLARAYYASR